ncbi:MAG TPA: single-stranded DNA-binding protein [Candidatus Kapabacteria bacterium]|jgi:single-strand DNA-binding protein
MASLKMPEVNHVIIAGNLTKDPVIRRTPGGIPVINFCLASNHRYRDGGNQWAEEVCYVGVVAWSKLADSCMAKLRKGSAVLVDGELQSRTWHGDEGETSSRASRTVVEIKAHRIQFLNKPEFIETEHASMDDELEFSDVHSDTHMEEKSFGTEFEYAAGFEEVSAEELLAAPELGSSVMELKLRGR